MRQLPLPYALGGLLGEDCLLSLRRAGNGALPLFGSLSFRRACSRSSWTANRTQRLARF